MSSKKQPPERLGAFSDGVFAVIITIMVLDLKPPNAHSFLALFPLWPKALSYAVSYLFIAIVWVNHHHLLRFAEHATPKVDLVELRTFISGLSGAVFDCLGCGLPFRRPLLYRCMPECLCW